MRDPENIRQVVQWRPDYLGFIFYPASPRYVGNNLDEIAEIEIPESIKKVGVFVDENRDGILMSRKKLPFNVAQLHGNESVSLCEQLRRDGLEVIKVFSVGERFDFNQMKEYTENVDYFLFDTKGKFHGGNSIPFDWNLINNYPFDKPFFLGGGIGNSNLIDITQIKTNQLFAIDVNSKLESSPGYKDLDKLKLFKEKFDNIRT